jgi:hypothetical protein
LLYLNLEEFLLYLNLEEFLLYPNLEDSSLYPEPETRVGEAPYPNPLGPCTCVTEENYVLLDTVKYTPVSI